MHNIGILTIKYKLYLVLHIFEFCELVKLYNTVKLLTKNPGNI